MNSWSYASTPRMFLMDMVLMLKTEANAYTSERQQSPWALFCYVFIQAPKQFNLLTCHVCGFWTGDWIY
jgi:hypothetical protein